MNNKDSDYQLSSLFTAAANDDDVDDDGDDDDGDDVDGDDDDDDDRPVPRVDQGGR